MKNELRFRNQRQMTRYRGISSIVELLNNKIKIAIRLHACDRAKHKPTFVNQLVWITSWPKTTCQVRTLKLW